MRQSSLLIIFLIVFLDWVAFGIIIPILPYYAQQLGASGWTLGWLISSYWLAQFALAPLWTRISDRWGRRPVLIISVFGTSISMALLALAGSLKWLFIGRIFAGVFGANITTAQSYASDITTEQDREMGMGLIAAGTGLGFIFGPAIGGVLSRYGFGVPMAFGALLAFANGIFAVFKLTEPPFTAENRVERRGGQISWAAVRLTLQDSRALYAALIFFLVTFGVTQLETVFAIYIGARFQSDAENAGLLLALMGCVRVAVQGFWVHQLGPKYGEPLLLVIGIAVGAATLASLSFAPSILFMGASLMILALGQGLHFTSLTTLYLRAGGTHWRSLTSGIHAASGTLAKIFGAPLAGWLFDSMSWRSPFFLGAISYSIAILLALLALRARIWARRAQRN